MGQHGPNVRNVLWHGKDKSMTAIQPLHTHLVTRYISFGCVVKFVNASFGVVGAGVDDVLRATSKMGRLAPAEGRYPGADIMSRGSELCE